MSAQIINLDQYRAARASQESTGALVLFGAEAPGHTCRHCGDELAHAMTMPSGLEGYGCRQCQVWYSQS